MMKLPDPPTPSPEEIKNCGLELQQTGHSLGNNQKMLLAFSLIILFVAIVLITVFVSNSKKPVSEIKKDDNPVSKTETVKNNSVSLAEAKARDAKRQSDMRQMESAQDMFYSNQDRYYTCGAGDGDCKQKTNNFPKEIDSYFNPTPEDSWSDGMVCGKDFIYCALDNTNQPQTFCYYAKLQTGGFYVVTPSGGFKKDTAPASFSDCTDGQVPEKTKTETAPMVAGTRVQIFPIEAEKTSCFDNTGKKYPGTGQGAARWFNWGDCPSWKIFSVEAGKPIKLNLSGDKYSCQLANFSINELDGNGQWHDEAYYNFDLGYSNEEIEYTPKTSRVKIDAYSSCFYLDVFKN